MMTGRWRSHHHLPDGPRAAGRPSRRRTGDVGPATKVEERARPTVRHPPESGRGGQAPSSPSAAPRRAATKVALSRGDTMGVDGPQEEEGFASRPSIDAGPASFLRLPAGLRRLKSLVRPPKLRRVLTKTEGHDLPRVLAGEPPTRERCPAWRAPQGRHEADPLAPPSARRRPPAARLVRRSARSAGDVMSFRYQSRHPYTASRASAARRGAAVPLPRDAGEAAGAGRRSAG